MTRWLAGKRRRSIAVHPIDSGGGMYVPRLRASASALELSSIVPPIGRREEMEFNNQVTGHTIQSDPIQSDRPADRAAESLGSDLIGRTDGARGWPEKMVVQRDVAADGSMEGQTDERTDGQSETKRFSSPYRLQRASLSLLIVFLLPYVYPPT